MPATILTRAALLKNLSDKETRCYKKALASFLDHPSHGANLEKLRHSGALYSIRVNEKARLILTPVKRNGQQVWLLVDILDQHQYNSLEQSKHWLAHQIEKINADPFEIMVEDDQKQEVDLELEEAKGVEFHQQQFILFDDHQQKATSATLPLIISGAPGSGKTSVALSLLKHTVCQKANHHEEGLQRLLFIAESQALVGSMKEEWRYLVDAEGLDVAGYEVEFKTPKELFEDYYQGQADKQELVDQAHFMTWFSAQAKANKNKTILSSQQAQWFQSMTTTRELVYQEFRTISGYDSFEDYDNQVGSKNSLFANPQERQWLWETYKAYEKHLKEHHLADLFFLQIKIKTPYDLIVADEAQDLSRCQLQSLAQPQAARENRVAYCIGDHQRVHDSRSIVPFIKSIFRKKQNNNHNEVNHAPLQASYRCPKQVVQLANAALQIKYFLTGGASDKNELLYVTSNDHLATEGNIYWLETEEELKPLLNDLNNAHFAVVTTTQYLAEAQKRFGAERVFTPEQIKGLEYQHVLLYKLLNDPRYKSANTLINNQLVLFKEPKSEAIIKSKNGSVIHNTIVNELFVAITRARTSISVYQPDTNKQPHPIGALLRTFMGKDENNNNIASIHVQATETKSSEQEWRDKLQQLKQQGQTEKVKLIEEKLAPPTAQPQQKVSQAEKKTIAKKSNFKSAQQKTVPASLLSLPTIKKHINPNQDKATLLKILSSPVLLTDLVMLPNAQEYLFKQQLSLINPELPNCSLYQWLHAHNKREVLLKTISDLLLGEVGVPKNKRNLKRIKQLIDLLFADTQIDPLKNEMLFVNLLYSNLFEPLALIIKQHWEPQHYTAFLTYKDDKRRLLIIKAIEGNDLETLKKIHLVRELSTIHFENKKNVAHMAILFANYNILRYLGTINFDFKAPDSHGITPLLAAIARNDIEAMQVLRDLKVPFDTPVDAGVYPVHMAALYGALPALETLKKFNIDINIRQKKLKQTPVFFALKNAYDEEKEGNTKYAKLAKAGFYKLQELGADLNIVDNVGLTVAHLAAHAGDLELLKKLNEWKVNLNQADYSGKSPADYAISKGVYNNEMKELGMLPIFYQSKYKEVSTSQTGIKPYRENNENVFFVASVAKNESLQPTLDTHPSPPQ